MCSLRDTIFYIKTNYCKVFICAPLKILYQQPRSLSPALLCGKIDETSMSRGHISMPNFVIFASKIILVSQQGMKTLHLNRKGNSFFAKSLLNHIENYWREVSESALFLKECIFDSSETEYAPNMTKNVPCTLNVIRKNNVNRLLSVHINIYFIRNKFDMPASQVEGNADVVMISETKLDDTFPVDQFIFEGFRKPFRIDRNKNGGGILLFVREDIPARLLSIEKAPMESFFIDLNLHEENWIANFSYYKNKVSSHLKVIRQIWIFILLIMIILSFSGISMQMLALKQCLT